MSHATARDGDVAAASFSRRIPLIVAGAFFMETLDATIIATALPAMARDLHTSALELSASITVYLIAVTVFLPSAGWVSNRFGARGVFAVAIGGFSITSLACAMTHSLDVLLIARAAQGSAAAFMSPVGRLIVLRDAPKNRIIDAISLIVWPGLIAPVIGPPLGGLITTYASWRWIFLLNLPLGLLGTYLVFRFVPKDPPGERRPFDSVGFALTALSLALTTYGLTLLSQNEAFAWSGAFVAIGLSCGLAAVRHSRRTSAPMVDLGSAVIPTFSLSTLSAGFIARVAISMTPFLLPLMFQMGMGTTAFQAGLMLLVYMAGNLAMKSATTPILRRFAFRRVIVVNGCLCAITLFGCGLLSGSVPLAATWVVLFAAGMSRSMNFTSTNTLAFADVPEALRASATTLAAIAQQVAAAFAIAMAILCLNLSQLWREGSRLALVDFRNALFAAGALMVISTLWSTRLDRQAGVALTSAKSRC